MKIYTSELGQIFGNYCSLKSFVWEKMKIIYFLETIAALGLKVA